MSADIELPDVLHICHLSDALAFGLELAELFGRDGDCCAVWLGDDSGSLRDLVICSEDRGRDAERLVRYASLSATLLDDVHQAVLWRTVDDITDGPALVSAFFDHQEELAEVDVRLVDEIALRNDELRSLAVTAFADRPGWDDVMARVAALEGDHPWPPWSDA